MLRIYFFCGPVTGRGGMESVMSNLCIGLKDLGHEVRILLTSASIDRTWEKKLPVSHLGKGPTGDIFQDAALLCRALDTLNMPDIIVALDTWQLAVAHHAFASIDRRPLLISWIHFSTHIMKKERLEWLSYADSHIAISTGLQEQLAHITPDIPSYLLFNPVSFDDRIYKRAEKNNFLFVGRLDNYQKRVDILLHALSKVTGPWHLDVIGDGIDRSMLHELAIELGISEKIKWHGWHHDPWSVLDSATALINSSDFEGLCITIIEALAKGVPVITTDCPVGPSDIVSHGENGWIFQMGSVDELALILNNIVHNKIEMPSTYTCRKSIESFEKSVVALNYERVLLKILNDAR